MEIEKTNLEGCFIIKPNIFKDERGTFIETFNKRAFLAKTGINTNFVQDNQSISKKGVLRGFHFQTDAYAQAKLVRIIKGEVQDVVVDLRKESKTFGQHFSIMLNDKNNMQLYIPKGFAHAFLSLTQTTIFSYKCDAFYHKTSENGIIYNDSTLNVKWKLASKSIIISEKDKNLPTFKALFS